MTKTEYALSGGATARPINILIAEDSLTQALKLGWLLEKAGYNVQKARTGSEAMEIIQKQLPDLLITDVVMPEMNGYDLCRAVRKLVGLELPIMLVTTLRSADDVLKGLKVGADNFITKPYQESYLLDQVDYLLTNRRLRRQRKLEMGIEIEFAGDRHFITADRQQILDLLISTYHEAVHLNHTLQANADKLKTTVNLQNMQLRLSTELAAAKTSEELFNISTRLLLSLKQVSLVWCCVQENEGNWRIIAGKSPASSPELVTQSQFQCLQNGEKSGCQTVEHYCLSPSKLESGQEHLCLPMKDAKGNQYGLHLLLAPEYGDFSDFSDSFHTIAQQIETNLQRVALLSELEKRVALRTRELAHSERRFQAIIESELFGVISLSTDGIVSYQNEIAQKLLHSSPEQSLCLQDVLTPASASPPLTMPLDKRLTMQPFVYYINPPDGETSSIMMKFSYLDKANSLLFGAFIDVSDLKRAEVKLERMQHLEAVANLTGGIAHDFNNLLSIVLGNTDILMDKVASTAEKTDACLTIRKAAQSGADLTKQLLAFARRQPLAAEPVNVTHVVQELKQFIDGVIDNEILLEINCPEDIWPIFTDYSQLESALLNLSINARDAMPNGGNLTITATNCNNLALQETLSGDPIEGDFVRIEVCDTGTGIPSSILAKVFEPFYTTKEEGKGTGMGLAMVYGFVKQCRGFLQVDSRPGSTRFALYFPPYRESKTAKLEGHGDHLNRGNKQLVLLVEDNADVRAIMVRHIKSLDYAVVEAQNAESAQKIIDEKRQEIAVVLTDVNLPGKSGLELAQQITSVSPDIPIVLTTGSSVEIDNSTSGVDHNFLVLRKPFRRHELAQIMADVLKK